MIFGRLTADTGKHQVRYRAREYQNSFAIHTDDPAVFECVSESDANRTINAALDIFDEEGVSDQRAIGVMPHKTNSGEEHQMLHHHHVGGS